MLTDDATGRQLPSQVFVSSAVRWLFSIFL
jgi:hypothetical protein